MTNSDTNNILTSLKEFEKIMVDGVIHHLIVANNVIPFPRYKADASINRQYPTDKKYLELKDKVKSCETSFPQLITNCRRIDYLEIAKFISKQNI